jgi:hypothetical protein
MQAATGVRHAAAQRRAAAALAPPGGAALRATAPGRAAPSLARAAGAPAAAPRRTVPSPARVAARPAGAPPPAIVVCPGFLADHRGEECRELAGALRKHFDGAAAAAEPPPVRVLPISRFDWYPTLRGGSFRFYLDALAEAVDAAGGGGARPVSLVALSAGGWLARLALGAAPYEGEGPGGGGGARGIRSMLVSLCGSRG